MPINQLLTATCQIIKPLEHNQVGAGINLAKKTYSEETVEVKTRFNSIDNEVIEDKDNETFNAVGKFYLSFLDLPMNSKIIFNGQTFRVKKIKKEYDFPNANKVHHLVAFVEDGSNE